MNEKAEKSQENQDQSTWPVNGLQLPTKRHQNILILKMCDKVETDKKKKQQHLRMNEVIVIMRCM